MEEVCNYYANDSQKLLFTDILEKRTRAVEKIRRHILSSSKFSEINEENFLKSVNAEHLTFMAKQVDEEFFDNNLFKTFDEKMLYVILHGKYLWIKKLVHVLLEKENPASKVMLNIKMMPKVFVESFKNKEIDLRAVDNLPCKDILTCFFMTFCHEMVHSIVFCNCREFDKTDKGPGSWKGITRPGNGHTKTFMSILNNRFGHSKFTHNLKRGITVDQLEREVFGQHNIKKGDVVILKVKKYDGTSEEKEALILSATKLQLTKHN